MRHLKNPVDPKSPGIQRKSRRYSLKLRPILTLASRQYPRPHPALAALYRTAVIEGISPTGTSRTAVITFKGASLGGSLIESFEWNTLDEVPEREMARILSWAVSEALKEAR